jgi:uncharacterized protein (TIGR00730 family)
MNQVNLQNETLSEDQFYLLNKISEEYKLGMLALNTLSSKTITFYGGSLIRQNENTFKNVELVAEMVAAKGWSVVSGGGPGVMKAALLGARLGKGKAVAFCIDIPDEPLALENPDTSIVFTQFSVRKYMLRQSDAFIFCPGGIGTLDELMELLTLIKTNKYPKKPVFLFETSFWNGYLEWIKNILLESRKTVSEDVLELFHLVDSAEEIEKILFK